MPSLTAPAAVQRRPAVWTSLSTTRGQAVGRSLLAVDGRGVVPGDDLWSGGGRSVDACGPRTNHTGVVWTDVDDAPVRPHGVHTPDLL
jgi:hypothetical protein